jgi:flagellar protein FlgJ
MGIAIQTPLPLAAPNTANDPARIQQVARDLESVFAQMMIKQMRASVGGDAMFPGDAAHFRDMHDQQLARQLSQGPGLGLASMIARQLDQQASPRPVAAEPTMRPLPGPPAALPLGERRAPLLPLDANRPAAPLPLQSAGGAVPRSGWLPTAPAVDAVRAALPPPPEAAVQQRQDAAFERLAAEFRPGSPEAFVAKVWPHAQKVAAELGVSPRAVVAQAALETGWGRSTLGGAGDNAHNYFGIKAGGRWQGEATTHTTTEFVDGVFRNERASFRAYGSAAESFADYARLLRDNPRYAAARGTGDDIGRFAQALQRGGYATDPGYADKLRAIAQGPTLQRALDALGVAEPPTPRSVPAGLFAASVALR